MPDKDGDDDKKSTKSVVNKKQKQMMGEEGYDIARDMGRVRPSKDKKDATTMPVSDEVKKTQKVNKGPSALERVKAKYGKAVMKVGKKKANEELDLTQVAEAFGGYIIESEVDDEGNIIARKGESKKQKRLVKREVKRITSPKPGEIERAKKMMASKTSDGDQKDIKTAKKMMAGKTDPIQDKELGALGREGAKVQQEIETETGRKTRKFTPASGTGLPTDTDDATIGVAPGEKAAPVYSFRVGTEREGPVAKSQRLKREKAEAEAAAKKKAERSAAASERNRNRKLVGSGSREVSPETQKKIDAVTPPFATKQGETGPLPVSMRNRRVPKTSSLSPNVKVTSIVKPKVGALTQTDFNKIVPFRRPTKTYNDFINPEVVDPGGPKPEKGGALGVDTGPTVIGQVIKDKPTKKDIKALEPPKIHGYLPPPEEKIKGDPPEPIADPIGGGKGGGKTKTKVGNFSYRPGGAFSKIRGFARRNPVLSLVGYDALKNLRVPRVEKPTKTGRVSAGS